jgi:hypothetical protein
MKTVYHLESVDDILHAFKQVRNEKDAFPYVGYNASINILDGNIFVQSEYGNFVVGPDVEVDDLLVAVFREYGIDLSFTKQ